MQLPLVILVSCVSCFADFCVYCSLGHAILLKVRIAKIIACHSGGLISG